MFTRTLSLRASVVVLSLSAVVSAAPLIGSGANLPIPSPNPGEPPRQGAALSGITGTGFNGTWTPPALAPWVGTFAAFGPVPAGTASSAGNTRYDFSALPTGLLPVGSYFSFGDVDGGSTVTEQFILTANDASGALITTPWLEIPLGVSGVGTGGGGAILPGNMPGWNWNPSLGQYLIDGTTVTGGNPSIAVWIENNTPMRFLNVQRVSTFANFGLSAPVPEPSTAVMLAIFGVTALRRRR